ncbi:MAG: hypothetical protein ACR2QM_20395, partial [Longimicrobiales bacterium]
FALLLTSPVTGQEAAFDVVSGYHDEDQIRFSERSVDWDGLVPPRVRAIPVPTADEAVLAELTPLRDMHGGAEVAVSIPVPNPVAQKQYYLIGSGSISELQVDSVLSVTRFDLNQANTRVVDRRSWGYVFASTLGSSAEGGFVASAEESLQFEKHESSLSPDDLLLGGTTARQTPDGGYRGRGESFWDILAQYRITLQGSGEEWVMVQWQPDRELFEVGCNFRYSLFRIDAGSAPTQVAWTSYGCDV